MTQKFKFNNGEEVQDLITGLTGIIDCSSIWINGCVRYSIQPKVEEGKNVKLDSWWMDEAQLVKVSDGLNGKIESKPTGGPSEKSSSARY